MLTILMMPEGDPRGAGILAIILIVLVIAIFIFGTKKLIRMKGDIFKKISPAVFGIALICFILPWANLSCGGRHVASFTGLEIATGPSIQQQGMNGHSNNQKVEAEPLAIFALFFTFAGLLFSFFQSNKFSLISASAAAIGFILLLFLKSKIDTDVLNRTQGVVQVEFTFGFWLILLTLIAASILNGYSYFISTKQMQVLPPQT